MRMTRAQWDELVAHAREEAPNECCGYFSATDGSVDEVVRATNERSSPYGYELDARSLLAAYTLDEDGCDVGIYHSHPRSAAEPSQTDINLAHYPQWTYVIVSLEGEPSVRAWRIADGRVEEEPVELAE
ncbi:MAG: M67 family metallopeptidase [Thermoleophilaceae bacterium]